MVTNHHGSRWRPAAGQLWRQVVLVVVLRMGDDGRLDVMSSAAAAVEAVRVLPNLCVDDGRVEAVEDAQGQCHALHDGPGQEAVEIELHRIGLHFLHLERVDEPQSEVGDEQEGDGLSARFALVLFRRAHPTPRHVRYEEHLRRHLMTYTSNK